MAFSAPPLAPWPLGREHSTRPALSRPSVLAAAAKPRTESFTLAAAADLLASNQKSSQCVLQGSLARGGA